MFNQSLFFFGSPANNDKHPISRNHAGERSFSIKRGKSLSKLQMMLLIEYQRDILILVSGK